MLGARAVRLHGISWPLATASTVVDVTAEFLAQIAFAALGLAILLARAPDSALTLPLAITVLLAIPAGAGFMWAQRGAAPVFARLGRHIAGKSSPRPAREPRPSKANLAASIAAPGISHSVHPCTSSAGSAPKSRAGSPTGCSAPTSTCRGTGHRGIAERHAGGRLPGARGRGRAGGGLCGIWRHFRPLPGTVDRGFTAAAGQGSRARSPDPPDLASGRSPASASGNSFVEPVQLKERLASASRLVPGHAAFDRIGRVVVAGGGGMARSRPAGSPAPRPRR